MVFGTITEAVKKAVTHAWDKTTRLPSSLQQLPGAVTGLPIFNRQENQTAVDTFDKVEEHSRNYHSKLGLLSWFTVSPEMLDILHTRAEEEVRNLNAEALGKAKQRKGWSNFSDEEVKKHLAAEKTIGAARWNALDNLVSIWYNFQGGFQSVTSLFTLVCGGNPFTGQHISRRESFAGVVEGLIQLVGNYVFNKGGATSSLLGNMVLGALLPVIHNFIAGNQQQPAYAYGNGMNSVPQQRTTLYSPYSIWGGSTVA